MKTTKVSPELIKLLNQALELEHSAYVQYLSHAEIVEGENAEPIIERLKEIAGDEAKHQEKFRTLIGDYLGGVPSTKIAPAHVATTIDEILRANLKDEIEAIDLYTSILEKIRAEKDNLPYAFLRLEHDVRHITMEEQEHASELRRLLKMKP